MFNQQLSTQYTPGTYMTVDEQLVPFRAHCPYGIKIWWAVDSETWYPLNGQVYLGKLPNESREVNQGQRVVKDVTRKWLNKGRNITAGNFFTSILLVTELLAMKTIYSTLVHLGKTRLRFHESFYQPKPGKCIQHYLAIQKK
jgi:hypothetical protein